jgi:hypothetical protein
MSERLPWVAAAVIIIGIAVLGAWVLTAPGVPVVQPTVLPPSAETWSASVWGSMGTVASELWSGAIGGP